MGFTVYYRSTRPVSGADCDAIRKAAAAACEGRTWLSCEPVNFYHEPDDGHLMGGSKPNFLPHPEDVAAAASEGLPDGTIHDALDVLCSLSREFGVDWELSHDHSAHIGEIRAGVCDEEAAVQIEALGELAAILGEVGLDDDGFQV